MELIAPLAGQNLADDMYQVRLLGNGGTVIQDLDGNALDGENLGVLPSGDGQAGGDYVAQFTISTPVVIGPTLEQIQAVVFTPVCSGCHGGAVPDAGLNLSTADLSFANLVNQAAVGQVGATRVIPTDPDNSYLIQKMEGNAGLVMPPSGMLPQGTINEIRQWITDGALR